MTRAAEGPVAWGGGPITLGRRNDTVGQGSPFTQGPTAQSSCPRKPHGRPPSTQVVLDDYNAGNHVLEVMLPQRAVASLPFRKSIKCRGDGTLPNCHYVGTLRFIVDRPVWKIQQKLFIIQNM